MKGAANAKVSAQAQALGDGKVPDNNVMKPSEERAKEHGDQETSGRTSLLDPPRPMQNNLASDQRAQPQWCSRRKPFRKMIVETRQSPLCAQLEVSNRD